MSDNPCEHNLEIEDCAWCACDGTIEPVKCGEPFAGKYACTLWAGHLPLLHPRATDDSDRYDHADPEGGAYWRSAVSS